MSQLTLDLFPDVDLQPTIAITQGESTVDQCGHCGTLVCRSGFSTAPPEAPISGPLGQCPACRRDAKWWPQDLGVGPFKRSDPVRAWSLWQHCATLPDLEAQIVQVVIRVGLASGRADAGQWVIYRVAHTPHDQSLIGAENCARIDQFRDLFPTPVTEDELQAIRARGGRKAA
jgi:hypothetical protein